MREVIVTLPAYQHLDETFVSALEKQNPGCVMR